MRGSDGCSKETFVSVRQAWGKGEEESAGEEEILDCGSRKIFGIEGAQKHREEIFRSQTQSCHATQEGYGRKRRKAHGGTFEDHRKEGDSKASAGA